MKNRLVALCILGIGMMANAATPASLDQLRPFLEKHCFDCHGAEKQKGDYRFDKIGSDLTQVENLETWQNILDQLNLGEMPPSKRPQPAAAEFEPVVEALTGILAKAYESARTNSGATVLRRLNRHELRNTLRDLLYLEGAAFRPDQAGSKLTDNNGNGSVERTGDDPLRFFPDDEEEDGFFNIGDRLVMSDFLLKLTLSAVEETLTQATHLEAKPEIEARTFAGHLVKGRRNGEHLIEFASREVNPDFDLIAQGYERYGRLSASDLQRGVGVSARHRITVEVSAHNADHPWGEMIELRESDPFQLCLNIADTKNGGIEGPTSTPLALWSIPADGIARVFTHEVWMDETWTPWIGWENGPHDRAFRSEAIVEKYLPDKFSPRPDKQTNKEAHDQWPLEMTRRLHEGGYAGPHLRIHSLTVEPLIEIWPPRSHSALYGSSSGEIEEIQHLLKAFAQRAFRRPVAPEEIAPFVDLVRSQLEGPEIEILTAIENLRYRVFEGEWSKLPEFKTLEPISKGELPNGLLDIGISKRTEKYGIVFEGKITAPRAGDYVFEMASDDGARILVDGEKVLEHDGLHGAQHKKGVVNLEAGEHSIRAEYFAFGAPNSFRAGWSGPGFELADLSPTSLRPSKPNQPDRQAVPTYFRAMQDGYAAILCSPQFLYLREDPGDLSQHEIASRLSYFLWSSMPDEQLFESAAAGHLTKPEILAEQVERMLSDPKAQAFERHFPSTWLRLDKLGKMPPSGGDFQFYKNLKVEPMLLKQVTTYFGEILETNGDIGAFIDSDYAYVNQVLAKWIYKREDIRGARFRKIALTDPRRGGIFTLPGIMTATANGVDTSPVVRGAWVLENLLGTPPPPPPPDVEPLATDTREAQTIREQLDLHRKHEACNSCHRKIDPMGFAFENFDVVGRWRDQYKGVREPIDSSATLSNGEEIADIVEFKKMLVARKPQVIRCLTEKMLTYAIGRQLEPADRGEVDRIVAELNREGDGLRDLVHLIAQSEVFRTK
ncbi:MAG: hypothetical protein ACI8UO_002516 [Verrucomicrobiales bacterium]|jgi:hypothetical protein